jgi:hypothetical protein
MTSLPQAAREFTLAPAGRIGRRSMESRSVNPSRVLVTWLPGRHPTAQRHLFQIIVGFPAKILRNALR